MKKLIIYILLFLFTVTSSGHWPYQQKPMLGMQIDRSHSLSIGLVGCWLMNEGSGDKVFDLSGNKNTGIITNPFWTAGDTGPCLLFDTGDYITFSNQNIIDVFDAGNSWSILVKARVSTIASGWSWLWCKAYTSHASPYYQVDIVFDETNYKFTGNMWRSDQYNKYLQIDTGNSSVSVNTWYVVALVYDGVADSLSIYLDGVLKGTDSSSDGIYSNYQTNIAVGVNLNLINAAYDWQGNVEYSYIYDRALSASEIALLHREPFCMYKEELPVELMYDHAVGVGQVILINISIIPLFLIPAFLILRKKKWQK